MSFVVNNVNDRLRLEGPWKMLLCARGLRLINIFLLRMVSATPRQQLQVGASFQNFALKMQSISVPDDYGIQQSHPATDYQVKAVRSILTSEPMSLLPVGTQQQASIGSLLSSSSVQSSSSSLAQQQPALTYFPVVSRYRELQNTPS